MPPTLGSSTSLAGQVGPETLLAIGLSCREGEEGCLISPYVFLPSHHDLTFKPSHEQQFTMFTPRTLQPLGMPLLEGPVGVEDLILLEPLDEESLIKNLQLRYENKEIYVSLPWEPGCRVPRGL